MNALTGILDPDRGFSLPFGTDLHRRPLVLFENVYLNSHINLPPRFLESMPLMRLVCWSDLRADHDKGLMEGMLRITAPDGIRYAPVRDLP